MLPYINIRKEPDKVFGDEPQLIYTAFEYGSATLGASVDEC